MKAKFLLAGLSVFLGSIGLSSEGYSQTLDAEGNINAPISASTISPPSTIVYQSTSEQLVDGGDNFSVGDIVFDKITGTQFKVTSLASVTDSYDYINPNDQSVHTVQFGPIGSMDVVFYGASGTSQVGQTADLVPMATESGDEISHWDYNFEGLMAEKQTLPPRHVITDGHVKIIAQTQVNIGNQSRALRDRISDNFNPRDYGVKLDGSSGDVSRFALFYAMLPDRSTIKFPCDSRLPPFGGFNDNTSGGGAHVGYTAGGKTTTWDLRCVGSWSDGNALDGNAGEGNLLKTTIVGGEWWMRNFNDPGVPNENGSGSTWGPILRIQGNYRGNFAGEYASTEYGQQNVLEVDSTAYRNARSTVQTLLINPQDYIQAKWSDQNTGLMEYAAMHNDSSFWPFVFQMTDTSGAVARGWTLTNEFDVGGVGHDYGTTWMTPDDPTNPPEPHWAPMDSARKVVAILPGSTKPDNSVEWTPFTYYNKGQRIYCPTEDSILVALNSGYSGATEPVIPGMDAMDGGVSKQTHQLQESGDLSTVPTAIPTDQYFFERSTYYLPASDGKSYYYYFNAVPNQPDNHQIYTNMASLNGPQNTSLMSELKPFDATKDASCDGYWTCWNGFVLVPVDPATITAIKTAYNGGTDSQMVTWDKVNYRTEEIGLGIDFQGEYGTPYGYYHNFDPIWITPISGQARLINAFLDASWMIDWAKNTATIRMHHDQKLDFDADGTEGGKNRRVLGYIAADQAMEFRKSDGSADPTAFTDELLFGVGDDGTVRTNSSSLGVVRLALGRNNANTFSFGYGDRGPVVSAYIDSSFMGVITHLDDSAPSSSTSGCNVGEEFDGDATYYYKCVATNTWKRIPWDTTSW